ncbi:uncharacterized protein RSE6_15014 [Rhynchosporium secalis]|uniref:Uncharacterized protein n=1 Tax=Rhynchosporium secalis TaxID=38038 RepID=A0A1E1MWW5_RHYSE|nr:uncharacterized protein RSE6_15014 [Rhynchosporium secalis]
MLIHTIMFRTISIQLRLRVALYIEMEEIPRRCGRIANRAYTARDQGEIGYRGEGANRAVERIGYRKRYYSEPTDIRPDFRDYTSASEDNEEEKATGIRLGKRRRGSTSNENVEEDISVTILHKRQRRSICEDNKEENGSTRISEDEEVEID